MHLHVSAQFYFTIPYSELHRVNNGGLGASEDCRAAEGALAGNDNILHGGAHVLVLLGDGTGRLELVDGLVADEVDGPLRQTLLRTLDRLKVDGMKTLRWFEALARKVANPSGDSRSRATKTGLAAYPPVTSTLKRCGSVVSPELCEKCVFHRVELYSAISPLVTWETLAPFV